jgi:hypothetical protein
MERWEIIERIKYLLLRDNLPNNFIEPLAEVLCDCFSNYNGFLKAQRVYDAQLCPSFRFKDWREVLIRAGYVIYPEHHNEPWKHFPGAKIKHLFPKFVYTKPKAEPYETKTKNEKYISELEKELSALKSKLNKMTKIKKGKSK